MGMFQFVDTARRPNSSQLCSRTLEWRKLSGPRAMESYITDGARRRERTEMGGSRAKLLGARKAASWGGQRGHSGVYRALAVGY